MTRFISYQDLSGSTYSVFKTIAFFSRSFFDPKAFNTATHLCCNRRVIPKPTPTSTAYACCGTVPYDRRKRVGITKQIETQKKKLNTTPNIVNVTYILKLRFFVRSKISLRFLTFFTLSVSK